MNKNTFLQNSRIFSFALLISVLFVNYSCNKRTRLARIGHLYVIEKKIKQPQDIVPVTGKNVIPYVYINTLLLDNLPVKEKKKKFFDLMLPPVLVAKTNLDIDRKHVGRILMKKERTKADELFLRPLFEKFKTTSIQELFKRMHTFPVSIVLAQAAIESGWGTSRFFLHANNPFGIWSFNPKHKRIKAASTRNGTKIYLRKYNNLEEAIDNYFLLLATGKPFSTFRDARLKTNNPDSLIQKLKMYSERRDAYVEDLARVMKTNRLKKYDLCRILPQYIRKPLELKAFAE